MKVMEITNIETDRTSANEGSVVTFTVEAVLTRKTGSQFLVNSVTTNDQWHPHVSPLFGKKGGFIVTWLDMSPYPRGFGESDVLSQRFDASGQPSGTMSPVNTTTASWQWGGSIEPVCDGGYWAVWQSYLQDGAGWGIFAQRFDANQSKLGSEIQVNTPVAGEQLIPQIDTWHDGGFVVVWCDVPSSVAAQTYGAIWSVYAQRFDALGNKVGNALQINESNNNRSVYPDVTALVNGDYAVSWRGAVDADGTTSWKVYHRVVSGSTPAEPAMSQIWSSQAHEGVHNDISATELVNGSLVVTWQQEDGSESGVFIQILDSGGQAIGDPFLVNNVTLGEQSFSEAQSARRNVIALLDGGFVVVWRSANPDGIRWDIMAQRFDATGNEVGSELFVATVNSEANSASQSDLRWRGGDASIAALGDDEFVIVWMDRDLATDSWEVYGQRYQVFENSIEYLISGISESDLSVGGLRGYLSIGADDRATIQVALSEDLIGESTETLTLTVGTESASTLVIDTDPTPRGSIQGLAYHWKSHMLLSDLDVQAVSSEGGRINGPPAVLDLRSVTIIKDAISGNKTVSVQVWANALQGDADFQFEVRAVQAASASFVNALDENWTVLANTISPSAILVGGFESGSGTESGPVQIGTLQLVYGPDSPGVEAVFSQIVVGAASGADLVLNVAHDTTNSQGSWSVSGLPIGSYALSASHNAADTGNAITSADALAALRIAVGLNPNTDPDGSAGPLQPLRISPYQIMAADVNGNGTVTSSDALAILRMAVKLPSALPREWFFVEEDRDFWSEATSSYTLTRTAAAWDRAMEVELTSDTTLNLVGILKGDVNGSWGAPADGVDLDALDPNYFINLATRLAVPTDQWGV
jgi:hypothetical protein